jgi:hypothetical protein
MQNNIEEILQRCGTSKFLEKDKLKDRFIKTGRLLSEPPQCKTPNKKFLSLKQYPSLQGQSR